MASNNSLDIKNAGIVTYDSTAGTFAGSAVDQYEVLVGGATNTVGSVGPGTAGQVLQSGGASANPAYSTATYPSTAGTSGNVLTSDGTNWVSSAPSGGGLAWNEETTTSVNAVVNNGYITNNAGAVTVNLPGTFAVGDTIAVVGKGAGGWIIDAPAGDTIRLGSSASSSGGTFTSTNQYDCVELVGTVANDTWTARSSIGNITIA